MLKMLKRSKKLHKRLYMRGNLIIQSGLRLSSTHPHPPIEIESSMTLDDPRREVVTLYMLYFSSPVKASHEDQHFESKPMKTEGIHTAKETTGEK